MPELSNTDIARLTDALRSLPLALSEALTVGFGLPVRVETPSVHVRPVAELKADESLWIQAAITDSGHRPVGPIALIPSSVLPTVAAGLAAAGTEEEPDAERAEPLALATLEAVVRRCADAMDATGTANRGARTVDSRSGSISLPMSFQTAAEVVQITARCSSQSESWSLIVLVSVEAAREALAQRTEEAAEAARGSRSVDTPPRLEIVQGGSEKGLARSLELLRDIPLEVSVELGRVDMLIRDVLNLAAGSIIELDRVAGEPVDLYVNRQLVAKGEVVVIEDNFGVRITEIASPAARLNGVSRKA